MTINTGTPSDSALIQAQEDERRRLAQELHDGVGQLLTGIRLHLEQLKGAAYTPREQQSYGELQALVVETIQAVREVSFDLMPSILVDFGLQAALRVLSERTSKLGTVRVTFTTNTQEEFPEIVAVSAYRIVQEALNNALKYAETPLIEISLTKDKKEVVLRIVDYGVGMDIDTPKNRYEKAGAGLKNMQTRARVMGGEISIRSEIGKGTEVVVTF